MSYEEEKRKTQEKIDQDLSEKSFELNNYLGKPEGTFSVVPEEVFYKELYNTYVHPEVARDLLMHVLGFSSSLLGPSADTDWVYTLRTFLTTGKRKEPDEVFGTIGCRIWWILFKAPEDVLPLLLNDPPPCASIALWRIRYGKPETDPQTKEQIKKRLEQPENNGLWGSAAERMVQILLRRNTM